MTRNEGNKENTQGEGKKNGQERKEGHQQGLKVRH